MSQPTNKLSQFWQELKRRKVVRRNMVYAATGFVILELVSIIEEPFGLPEWTVRLVFVILFIGLIISIILSWIYDITPEGIEKTKPSGQNNNKLKQPASIGWKISTYISVLVVIAFVLFYIIGNIKRSSDISKLEKTIAVIPFNNFSSGDINKYLGDAIADEIATQLGNINEFQVRSFTSSSQYKGDSKPSMPQIGMDLSANFIIAGSIELQDEEVSINVRIIQAENDYQLFAEPFKGHWEDITTMRADIALRIAEELKTILSTEEIKQIEKRPTDNPDAYQYYIRGNDYYWRGFAERDWSNALRMYQRAIELDPDFALAYTKIAISRMFLFWYGFDTSLENLDKCNQAIDAAFNLDPNIPEGYIAKGLYHYWGFLEYTEALKQFEIALQIMPNNNDCLYYMGLVYRRMGQWRKSIEMMEESLSYDPNNHRKAHNIAATYYYLNEYSKALEYYDLSIKLNPDFSGSYTQKMKLFLKWEGNTINARETLKEASLFLNLSYYPVLVWLAVKLDIYDGLFDEAIKRLNTTNFEAVPLQLYYYPKPLLYARIYDLMGDSEQAYHYYDMSRIALENKILEYPDDGRYYSSLGICYAGLGLKDKALEAGIKSVESWPIGKRPIKGAYLLGELALIYTMVEEFELALEQLNEVLLNPGFLSTNQLQLDPAWKPLWNLPGFIRLIEKYDEK